MFPRASYKITLCSDVVKRKDSTHKFRGSSRNLDTILYRVLHQGNTGSVIESQGNPESFRYTSFITRSIGCAEIRVGFSKLVRGSSF